MSAVVRAISTTGMLAMATVYQANVPGANGYDIDGEGRLILRTSTWGGEVVAIFQKWESFVITPDRGPNGRFIKKGN